MKFRSGDVALYNKARSDLKKGIRRAKQAYKNKVEDYLLNDNTGQVLKHITNYKGSVAGSVNTDITLTEALKQFFACFVKPKDIPASHTHTAAHSFL